MGVFSNVSAAQNLFIQSNQPVSPVKGALWINSGDTPRPTLQIFDGTDFNDEVEVGSIVNWGGAVASIPTGWLLCNDQAISRTTFSTLFSAIGTRYGVGDGSSTFNVPDLRGKFPRGAEDAQDPGSTGGEDTHALTTAELATHNHGVTDGGHIHGFNASNSAGSAGTPGDQAASGTLNTNSATTGISINNAGSGTAHENKPAFQEVLYIIKT